MSALFNLWAKFTRSKKYRDAFVAAQLKRGIPNQIRILRKQRGWSQADLAKAAELTQGAVSRAEDPDYGNLTFNNVLKIASGLDVAFVGRFVPFSELAHWQTNLSEEALRVPSFPSDSVYASQGISVTPPYSIADYMRTGFTYAGNFCAGSYSTVTPIGLQPQYGNTIFGALSQAPIVGDIEPEWKSIVESSWRYVPRKSPQAAPTSTSQLQLLLETSALLPPGERLTSAPVQVR